MILAIQPTYDEDVFLDAEAKREAMRARAETLDEFLAIKAAIAHRHYLEAIEPWVKQKMRIYMLLIPKILIHPDGRLEQKYDLSPELQKLMNELDSFIAMEARKWHQGLKDPVRSPSP